MELERLVSLSTEHKKKGMFHKKTTGTTGEMKGLQLYAIFSAARSVPDLARMGGLPTPHICAGLTSENPLAVRHALALILELVDKNPIEIAEAVRPLLGQGKVQLTDHLAAVYWTRLVARIALEPPARVPADVTDEFLRAVARQHARPHPSIFLAAVHALSAAGWDKMEQLRTVEGKPLVPALIHVFASKLLSDPSPPILHAALRGVSALAESAARALPEDQAARPFDSLKPCLKDHNRSKNLFVKVKAVEVQIWLTPVEDMMALKQTIQSLVSVAEIPSHCVGDIFRALTARVSVAPTLGRLLLDLSVWWATLSPPAASPRLLVDAWAMLLKRGLPPQHVATALVGVLDATVEGKWRSMTGGVQQAVIWIIATHASVLAGLTSEGGVWQTTGQQDMLCGTSCLDALVLRLNHIAVYATHELRLAAVDALGRLSLFLPDPHRIELFEVLSRLARSPAAGMSMAAAPYLALLDRVYFLEERKLNVHPLALSSVSLSLCGCGVLLCVM